MFCRQCGNRLDTGSMFCANCGAKANTAGSAPDPAGAPSKPIFGEQTKEFLESIQPGGFFQSLFDFSFTSLVTTKLIKFLYALSIAGLALASLFWVVIGFYNSPATGVFALVFIAPLFFLFGVCYTRVTLEIMIVIFRICEHTTEIARQLRIKEVPAETKSGSQ